MTKYIIKNCPNYFIGKRGIYCDLDAGRCQDCTDCVMKQIVEKCRATQQEYPKYSPDGKLDMFISGKNNLAGIIISKLDIQEAE